MPTESSTMPSRSHERWVDIWAAMPQLTEPENLPPASFRSSKGVFHNATIRQTVKVTLPANVIRIRISNAFGLTPLVLSAVTIANPFPDSRSAGSSTIDPDSLQMVTFGDKAGIAIPNGALVISDPITHCVKAGDSISISIYLAFEQEGHAITSHPGSRTTSWLCFDNQTECRDLPEASIPIDHWYFLSCVEGYMKDDHAAFVIIGDSITDGRGSTTNGNDRWPDLLSHRMQRDTMARKVAVINQGAGGNRLLSDGLGPNAWSRITRDVLGHSGVKYAMIFEGVNDIGCTPDNDEDQEAVYDLLIAAYRQMVLQIQSHGIIVFGATIPPFGGARGTNIQPYASERRDRTRRAINRWILEFDEYDYVADFATALEDPRLPGRLLPEYDSGDYLHPSPAGYRRMAEVIDIAVFGSLRAKAYVDKQ